MAPWVSLKRIWIPSLLVTPSCSLTVCCVKYLCLCWVPYNWSFTFKVGSQLSPHTARLSWSSRGWRGSRDLTAPSSWGQSSSLLRKNSQICSATFHILPILLRRNSVPWWPAQHKWIKVLFISETSKNTIIKDTEQEIFPSSKAARSALSGLKSPVPPTEPTAEAETHTPKKIPADSHHSCH